VPAAAVLKLVPRSSVCVPEQIKSVSGPCVPKVIVGEAVWLGLTLMVTVIVAETVAEVVTEVLTDAEGLVLGLSLIVGVGVGLVASGHP
jgi:hypothetical protein